MESRLLCTQCRNGTHVGNMARLNSLSERLRQRGEESIFLGVRRDWGRSNVRTWPGNRGFKGRSEEVSWRLKFRLRRLISTRLWMSWIGMRLGEWNSILLL